MIWIGGGTGTGKTTVTRALAGAYGLRVFPVDAFWYSHADRLAQVDPDPDEQWLRPPAEQAAEFEALARQRWPLIRADVEALPARPMTVVEGPQLLPDLLPPGAIAVFLISTAEFQRANLLRRGMPPTSDPEATLANRIEKDRLYAARVADLAREHGFPTVSVDGSRSSGEILTEVERILAPLHASATVDEVRAARQWENGVVAENIRRWLASSHAPVVPPATFPFACECGTPGCADLIDRTLDAVATAPTGLLR